MKKFQKKRKFHLKKRKKRKPDRTGFVWFFSFSDARLQRRRESPHNPTNNKKKEKKTNEKRDAPCCWFVSFPRLAQSNRNGTFSFKEIRCKVMISLVFQILKKTSRISFKKRVNIFQPLIGVVYWLFFSNIGAVFFLEKRDLATLYSRGSPNWLNLMNKYWFNENESNGNRDA